MDSLQAYKGLTSSEAKKRLALYGPNVVISRKKHHVLLEFLSKFTNPLILILLLASFISAWQKDFIDFFIIFTVIILSVVIDFIQEHQSEKASVKLQQKVAIKVEVIRDGEKKEIPIAQVTIGDIVLLRAGDIVPADMKILSFKDLHVDESTLTGESFPVEKTQKDKLLMGTSVLNGEAISEVLKIGRQTEFGKIADTLTLRRPETDFERGIKDFSFLVVRLTFVLVIIIFFANALFKHNFYESVIFALALAVGLTPELLPMIVTVNLAKGAIRMSKKDVIVKHLPSIQNLGSMNILCTDKTGTITENKIKLERYENIEAKDDTRVLTFAYLNSFFQSNLKNPLDEAILTHKEIDIKAYEKIDEIPFDFVRKRLSVALKKEDKFFLISKGAVDEMWSAIRINPQLKQRLHKRYDELSKQGFRVLTVAYKSGQLRQKTFTKSDERDLIFLGFTAFLDPPKHDIKYTLEMMQKREIKLKILTGDNENVTRKICQELGIPVTGVVYGNDIKNIEKANLFVKLTPQQKEKIITNLKKSGQVVGYLGDGINDAPSLRSADIGISVNNAVDVAKSAADIILLKKSLTVLNDGILEGRKTFANTLKYIFMGTGSNFGNMFSVAIASLFLPFLPMLPTQILINNLLYDLSQLTIPADNVDEQDLQKPQHWNINFIKRFIFVFGPISSIFDILTFVILLAFLKASVPMFRTGWFVESIVTQSLVILLIRTKQVPFIKSRPANLLIFSAVSIAILGILITQLPFGQLAQFTHLPFNFWGFLAAVVILYFLLVEAAKAIFYRRINYTS